ncbi:unnamed protein product [Didymodactylos carnosus]|uniref:Iron-binding zinc finger CDGSH type domain-containing protein n=1 Tax=Didymodactylos carnosus TaxID=1234261 RepID=A0A814F8Q1_9BILA|nr:unnamed protein product [Didymodactylos carnosus]CAF0979636.1 unnamed protein product [Didymodactylos carnosus]CAF3510141.1 unnamed protein product [Didymodactylos carnosus]CAF3752325.1 unnamed protein product [Didymodactylos carnosus]
MLTRKLFDIQPVSKYLVRCHWRTVQYPDLNQKVITLPDTHEEKIALPLERPRFIDEYSTDGPPIGRVYEKIPFKMQVVKGRAYLWCTCGWSHAQPFCDGSHKHVWGHYLHVKNSPKYRPIKWVADETKDVWFCNCKQTKQRPFCDGTHRLDIVQKQDAIKN